MNKQSRIIDNSSMKDLLGQLRFFSAFETFYRAIPFSKKLFPKYDSIFNNFSEIKKQSTIIFIPDKFNDIFSSQGWIAYDSMNLEVMSQAIELYEANGMEQAELFLALFYDEDKIKWELSRFKGHVEFRKRIRLANLAKEDYLAERYHACIPLLLSLLDGLVNDISKQVGFFAENTNLTAWDCIAGHETGLQTLTCLMSIGRNKTNEEKITIPYRNGILHGRELEFDNKIVAAKCWAALFATKDWAIAISKAKNNPKPEQQISWKESLKKLLENERQKKLLDEWKPRSSNDRLYLPYSGVSEQLPDNTPEKAVAKFIENWTSQRYGLLADDLAYFTNSPKGKKAGMAKSDFSRNIPLSYKILDVEDLAPAISHVTVELIFSNAITKKASVRMIYQDSSNNALVRSDNSGSWKVFQNSLSEIIYTYL